MTSQVVEYDTVRSMGHDKLKAGLTKRAKKFKVHKVMSEFKHGMLHSGSKKGPKVTSRKQAIAIALSEAGMGRK